MTQKSPHQNGPDYNRLSKEDRQAIQEGLEQLDRGEFLTRVEVKSRIRRKYSQ